MNGTGSGDFVQEAGDVMVMCQSLWWQGFWKHLTCFGCSEDFVLCFHDSVWLTFISRNCVKGSCQEN